jgi:hypothetical protein
MIEIVHKVECNVERWRDGDMALRWTAAGMLEAARKFRRIVGSSHLATLVEAIERERATATAEKEVATPPPA